MSEIHVKGLADLQKFLDQLPVKTEKNILRGALRAAMKPVQTEAKARVGVISGQLRAGLKISTRTKYGKVTASLKAGGKHGYLARWIEYGTRPHLISVPEAEKNINFRRSMKLGRVVKESMTTINRRVLQIGNNFVGPTVSHPGIENYGNKSTISGHSFMRPALDTRAKEAVVAAGNYIKNRLATRHGLNTAGIIIEGDE